MSFLSVRPSLGVLASASAPVSVALLRRFITVTVTVTDGVPSIMEASAAVTVRIREYLHVLGVELRDLIKLIRCPLLSTRRAGCQPFFHF